jgi:hypothetical protein
VHDDATKHVVCNFVFPPRQASLMESPSVSANCRKRWAPLCLQKYPTNAMLMVQCDPYAMAGGTTRFSCIIMEW